MPFHPVLFFLPTCPRRFLTRENSLISILTQAQIIVVHVFRMSREYCGIVCLVRWIRPSCQATCVDMGTKSGKWHSWRPDAYSIGIRQRFICRSLAGAVPPAVQLATQLQYVRVRACRHLRRRIVEVEDKRCLPRPACETSVYYAASPTLHN